MTTFIKESLKSCPQIVIDALNTIDTPIDPKNFIGFDLGEWLLFEDETGCNGVKKIPFDLDSDTDIFNCH